MDVVKKYKLKSGNILKIIRDEYAESPDIWKDETLFLVYKHREFTVEREGFNPEEIYQYLEDYYEQIENDKYDNYFIFPVDAYIHSGIHLSLSNTVNYPDRRWDVSTTGYILVNQKYIENNFIQNNNGSNDLSLEIAKEKAKSLIETWNQYLSSDVYGYTIINEEICSCCGNKKEEKVDSCWGFYGEDVNTNGILDHINDEIIEVLKP